jgi:hypothetical protein
MKTNVVKMLWPPSISGHKGDVPPIKQLSTAKAHLRILRPPLDINDRICTHGLLLCFYITSVELAWHILRDHLCISALWCYFLVQNACWTQPPFFCAHVRVLRWTPPSKQISNERRRNIYRLLHTKWVVEWKWQSPFDRANLFVFD